MSTSLLCHALNIVGSLTREADYAGESSPATSYTSRYALKSVFC
jgi:hypothetical protein